MDWKEAYALAYKSVNGQEAEIVDGKCKGWYRIKTAIWLSSPFRKSAIETMTQRLNARRSFEPLR